MFRLDEEFQGWSVHEPWNWHRHCRLSRRPGKRQEQMASMLFTSFSSSHQLYPNKMTYKISYDIKSSALIIALILVPIVVLVFVVVIALACSNYWSIHSLKESFLSCLSCFCLRKQQRRKKIPSDSETCPVTSQSTSAGATEASDTRIEFNRPVTNREHI
jgi:hypothetical protein